MKEQLIAKYFSNTLNEDEIKLFLELKNNDPEFREELEFQENLILVCKIEDDLKFKKMIASFEEALKQEKKSFQINRYLYYKIAVAVVLFISFGYLANILFLNKPNNMELFAEYFEPSKNVSHPITRSSSEQEKLFEVFIAYENKNYTTALVLFENYFIATKDTTILYYQANVLLAINKPDEALEVLVNVENSSSNLAPRTHWYKALAYLKTNRQTEAVNELEILLNNKDEFKKEEAKKLLKKLK